MKPIILHVPKTGGTTLIINLLNTNSPPKPNVYYRHINNLITGENNCKELIDNYEKYKNNKIIIFLRDPLERLFSEFCFLRNRKEFIILFKNKFPNNFEEYILSNKTHNQICKFILGIDLYSDQYKINENDYNKIINFFENSDIVYCLTEQFSKSLVNIENKLNIEINKNILNFRENLNKLEKTNWDHITKKFESNNIYDIKLYNFFKNKFNKQLTSAKLNTFNFIENKYHSLLLYTSSPNNRCPLNIFNPNSIFVENNKNELININEISRINIKNGKEFAINWLRLFINKYKLDIFINNSEPLETIKEISKLEDFL